MTLTKVFLQCREDQRAVMTIIMRLLCATEAGYQEEECDLYAGLQQYLIMFVFQSVRLIRDFWNWRRVYVLNTVVRFELKRW